MSKKITKYHLSSRILHWLMAVIIIFLLGLGIYMANFLSEEAPNRLQIYNLHKSFGVLVLVLVFIRIVNRLCHRNPRMPETMAVWEKFLAYTVHGLLYILMILVPLSGYLMSNYFGYGVSFFKFETLSLVAKNLKNGESFAIIHELSAYALLVFIMLHLLGAIKHQFFDRPENKVMNRIF